MHIEQLSQEIEQSFQDLKEKEQKISLELNQLSDKIVRYTRWAWGFIIFGFAIILIGIYIVFFMPSLKINELGDFYGGALASVWSLAGLFFIYVAFLGQKQQLLNQQLELNFNHLELKATRLELHGQKQQMVEQNKTLQHQRFENTFFNLLNLHHEIVNGIDLTEARNLKTLGRLGEDVETVTGRDCFVKLYTNFRMIYKEEQEKLQKKGAFEAVELINKAYLTFNSRYQSDIAHYFGNLYTICKFIKFADVEDKKTYSNMVRAQLSSHELLLLFYNCLSDFGKHKFHPIVGEYALLKNMPVQSLLDPNHISLYPEKAFGNKYLREK
jgi:hypothetical protein